MGNEAAQKPRKAPEWATDGGADVVEPSLAQKQTGWPAGFRPPAGWENWKALNVFEWIKYFRHLAFDNFFPVEPPAGWTDVINGIDFIPALGGTAQDHWWLLCGDEGVAISPIGYQQWVAKIAGIFNACCFAYIGSGNPRQGLAVGASGLIKWSSDQFNTVNTPAAAGGYVGTFRACRQGSTNAIIAGSGGEIQYSPTLAVWTKATLAAPAFTGNFRALALGFIGSPPSTERLLAVGDGGEIRYSVDGGVNWIQATPAGGYSGDFYCAAWGTGVDPTQGVFVIGGEDGEIQWSLDCITWNQASDPIVMAVGKRYHAAVWTGSGFFITGEDGKKASSIDGDIWVPHTHGGIPKDQNVDWRALGTDGTMTVMGATAGGTEAGIVRSLRLGGYVYGV